MKAYSKIRGTMEVVPNIEVNVDTVYVRSNIVAVNESDFTGWEYDEIQYGKNEYIELMDGNQILLQEQLLGTQDNFDIMYAQMLMLQGVTVSV